MSDAKSKAMRRFLIAFVPALLILALLYVLVLTPQMSAREEALASLEAAKAEADRLDSLVRTLPYLEERHSILSELLPDIRRAITVEPETAEVLAQVNGFCEANEAMLMSFSATPPGPGEEVDELAEMGLSATISGSYDAVYGVLTDIQAWGRLITVDDLSVSSDGGEPPIITVGLRMRAFVQGGEGG